MKTTSILPLPLSVSLSRAPSHLSVALLCLTVRVLVEHGSSDTFHISSPLLCVLSHVCMLLCIAQACIIVLCILALRPGCVSQSPYARICVCIIVLLFVAVIVSIINFKVSTHMHVHTHFSLHSLQLSSFHFWLIVSN